jgi:hypothetical protein
MITITLIWIVVGQSLHSVLRTSGVRAIATASKWKAIALNAASHVVRATVMAGTVSTIMETDYRGIIAVALGSVIGDWIALRSGKISES